MQRVQSTARREPPERSRTRTRWRFGSNRRGVTLWAWETLRPKTVFFPQDSQTLAMALPSDLGSGVENRRILPDVASGVKSGRPCGISM